MILERIKTPGIAYVAYRFGNKGEGTVVDPPPLDVAVRPRAAPDAACPRAPDARFGAREHEEHE